MSTQLEHDARSVAEYLVDTMSSICTFPPTAVDDFTKIIIDAVDVVTKDINAYTEELAKVWRNTNPQRSNWDELSDASTKRYEVESMRAVLDKLAADGRLTSPPAPESWASWQDVPEGVMFTSRDELGSGTWTRRHKSVYSNDYGTAPVPTFSLDYIAPFIRAEVTGD